ncbi:hypothetical protein KFL_001840210 [Klebsormidium nitens]|uniref:Uncharacterized protein n=1 Tax=Klebsormidium nitens TaxID=105231 RepID=A0A1Y1I2Y4_KLENI|nr:hypothetical protein KFL_001840210 [Klebsormidium nitens]|eukprot:GAQ84322.1 hypothetical protein KFL_001840210 [Klebsormidium nitens]
MEKLELQGRSAPLAVRRLSSPFPSPASAHEPARCPSSSPGRRKSRRSLPAEMDHLVRKSPSGADLDGAGFVIEKAAGGKERGPTGEAGGRQNAVCLADVVAKGLAAVSKTGQDTFLLGASGTPVMARSLIDGVTSAGVQEEAKGGNSQEYAGSDKHTGPTVPQEQAETGSNGPAVVSGKLVTGLEEQFDCLGEEASLRGELASQPRASAKSPSEASSISQKANPRKSNTSSNAGDTAAKAPLSPRMSSLTTEAKARMKVPAKRNPTSEPRTPEPVPVSSQPLSPAAEAKPRAQTPGIRMHVASPNHPGTSPTKHPRGVLTPQPLHLASLPKRSPDPSGTMSPPGPKSPQKTLSPRGALSPTGGIPRDPPRGARRSSTLSLPAEGETGAGSPSTSPESAARAEALQRATQLRLEKWRAEQEASALKAKRLEDTKREEERRRRETALELKEKRRAEIYALNHKLREEEERRVDAYRRERERRDRESGADAKTTASPRPLALNMSGHHMAA